MTLTLQTTQHLAHLARIHLSAAEQEHLTQDMQSILHFIDQLSQVDLNRLRPDTPSTHLEAMRMEEDVVCDQVGSEHILASAPQQACSMFVVPKMVE